MALINASQLIGKQFYIQKSIPFYKVSNINSLGDKAKPSGNLKVNYSFVLHSYLQPKESGYKDQYGLNYAKLTDYYFTFYGNDKNYYAVKYAPDNRFSLKKLIEQGTKTVVQEQKEQEEKEKTPIDKITDLFSEAGSSLKKIIYIGLGIYAIGYLMQKSK
jgi:hypothetical protein